MPPLSLRDDENDEHGEHRTQTFQEISRESLEPPSSSSSGRCGPLLSQRNKDRLLRRALQIPSTPLSRGFIAQEIPTTPISSGSGSASGNTCTSSSTCSSAEAAEPKLGLMIPKKSLEPPSSSSSGPLPSLGNKVRRAIAQAALEIPRPSTPSPISSGSAGGNTGTSSSSAEAAQQPHGGGASGCNGKLAADPGHTNAFNI